MNSAINKEQQTLQINLHDSYCQKKKNIYNMSCVSSSFKQDQVCIMCNIQPLRL